MIVITIILYGYKTIGAASYPLSINDAKHPLTILKGINTTDEKMTNPAVPEASSLRLGFDARPPHEQGAGVLRFVPVGA